MRPIYLVLLLLVIAIGIGLLLSSHTPRAQVAPPTRDGGSSVEPRVSDLLRRMTLEEKVALLAGSGWMETTPVARLGIPSIKMADGPMGVRSWLGSSAATGTAAATITSTAFPAGMAMGATWDPELVQREGQAIGQEVTALGRDMILGPTVNIARVPLWGRDFEGYGEDPYLAGRLAVAFIRGVQGEGAIAAVKHFAANNQEFERHRIDESIDERALQEIYLPAFRAAVEEAGVWSVMSAYNKVNGSYCAENTYLLRDVLRKQWGFRGFVVSDWGSTYSTAGTVNAGMDVEMPGGQAMRDWIVKPSTQKDGNGCGWLTPDKVLAEVKAGKIPQAAIDENAGSILRVLFETGLMQKQHAGGGQVDTPEQKAVARTAATEGIVLLKNEGGLLPLDAARLHSIAVIGPNAAVARTGGGGSSLVRPKSAVPPLDGIRALAGKGVKVDYALGVSMEGEDASKDSPAARERLRKEATDLAAKAEIAIVVVGNAPWIESEDFDRKSMNLPAGQDELIDAVAKANKNTIVVINAGSPVAMDGWVNRTPAILDMWYGGEEGGNAIADILFGTANPSGKLPVTFPKKWEDSPAYGHYPGTDLHVAYAEGIYVGYRYFDTKKVEPLFPFGHGLSFTKFDLSNLQIKPAQVASGAPVEVTFQVSNRGSRAGAEVVQVYVHQAQSSVDRPEQELKGFRRVFLKPGETQAVKLTLDRRAMSFYSPTKKEWVAEPGEFEIRVGTSSRDIRLRGSFDLAAAGGKV